MNKAKFKGGDAVLLWVFIVFLALPITPGPAMDRFLPDTVPSKSYSTLFQEAENDRIAGELERSLGLFETALKVARKANNAEWETGCLMKLGLLQWSQGRVPEASRYFSDAFEKAKVGGKRDVQTYIQAVLGAIRLYNQGKDLRQANDLQGSAKAFHRALDVSRKIAVDEISVKCLRQMSLTYWQMNDLKTFQSNNEEALLIAKKLKLRREEARCLNNIGLYHWKSTDYSASLRYFQEALILIRNSKDAQFEAELLSNMGLIYKELGDFNKAYEYFEKALIIDRELNSVLAVPIDLINIGSTCRDKSNAQNNVDWLVKALGYFKECMQTSQVNRIKQLRVSLMNNIGTTYTDLYAYDKAIPLYQAAVKEAKEGNLIEEISFLYTNLGEAYLRKNDINTAANFYIQAISLANNNLLDRILWEAYFGLGQCYEKRGESTKALSCYESAVRIIDNIRSRIFLDTFKAGFARNKVNVYERLLNVLFLTNASKSGGPGLDKMFSVIERAKARAFLESLGEAKIDIKENLPAELGTRETDLTKEISSIILDLSSRTLGPSDKQARIERLERAEDEYMRLISEMKLAAPEVANLVAPDMCALEDLQNSFLDDKTGMIEYLLGETKSYMFYISKKTARIVELPSRTVLEASLKGYIKAIMISSSEETASFLAGERIAKEILHSVTADIDTGIKRLIIVPDGILYYLPFETLRVPRNRGPGREYLIERFELSYASSASSLVYLSRRKMGARPKALLAFGDPARGPTLREKRTEESDGEGYLGEIYQGQGFDFRPLPFSRKEVLDIAKHFPEKSRQIFLGRDAREDTLKNMSLRDYQIVHFACHGLIDENVPFRSALVLSTGGAPNDDGLLQAREIYTLRMDADLVVLSACQTGKGRLERGEGILGLARMFFYAGSKSVISTLWPIEDRSTAVFMDRFYDFLVRGCGKAEALRLAKIDMLSSKYSHPFYWAAFVLNGDSGAIFPGTTH